MPSKETIERLAEIQHQQWQYWASWILDNQDVSEDLRWRELLRTDYRDLSERDKNADREWAKRCYAAMQGKKVEPPPVWAAPKEMEMNWNLVESDILGALDLFPKWTKDAPSKDAPLVELTPAQLSALDRKLTPEEQAKVDKWQGDQAAAELRDEEAKGGPKAIMTVTPSGATVTRAPGMSLNPFARVAKELRQPALTPSGPAMTLAISGLVGSVLGGVAGALLWKNHRILGFFLSSAFIGAPLGYGTGRVIAMQQAKKG